MQTNEIDWKKLLVFSGIAIVVIGLLSTSGYFFYKYQNAQAILNNPQLTAEQQTKLLIKKIGQLIDLPAEEPTLATVSNVEKLRNQLFFKKAENGDKVLIFTNAKKAILYRPSANKIIEVAPISFNNNVAGVATPSGTIKPTVSLTPSITLSPSSTIRKPSPSITPIK